MSAKISPLISPAALLELRKTHGWILIDASNGPGAKENYHKSHLHGALHVDLNTQLANVPANAANGGRHPLPSLTQFSQFLSSLGIATRSHVVIYDDSKGANAAARLWWMLRAVGVEKVQVVDGGLQAALAAGFPTSRDAAIAMGAQPFPVYRWALPTADIQEVEAIAQDPHHLVIDVRDAYRYDGESEPIDLIAGHIPGAVNIPYATNLDENGFFRSPEALKAQYEAAFGGRKAADIVVHCGSGVTACHTLLAVAYAGMEIPKLYVGSWSEWSRTGRPMVTKTKD